MSKHIDIMEDVLLIRPTRLYYRGIGPEELYEITRGIWKVAERREKAIYAFSVVDFKVKAVYRIDSWHRAMDTEYRIRQDLKLLSEEETRNRYEFVGSVDPAMQIKYLGQDLGYYYSVGNANPVMSVNC